MPGLGERPAQCGRQDGGSLIELLIDRYHFKDEAPQADSPVLEEGFRLFVQNYANALSQIHSEQLVKVLAAVYRSIQRRTAGGTVYLQFVSQYTGIAPEG